MDNLYKKTFTLLENIFRRFEKGLPAPTDTTVNGYPAYRYTEKLTEQAILLKLARQISGLHAAYILLKSGLVQEQGVIQRTLDDIHEDIIFLVVAITNDEITELHKRFLEAFWQEEFDGDPISSPQNRDMPQRAKIRSYIANVLSSSPHDEINVHKTVYKAYSGFVHAASTHIMDTYLGPEKGFHVSGMLGTPRIYDYENDIFNYFYRAVLSFSFASKAYGDENILNVLTEHMDVLANAAGKDYK